MYFLLTGANTSLNILDVTPTCMNPPMLFELTDLLKALSAYITHISLSRFSPCRHIFLSRSIHVS